jgi:transcriptional antiterminator
MDQNEFETTVRHVCNIKNGFVTFNVSEQLLQNMMYEVSLKDLEEPPNNKQRKIIFKDNCQLTLTEKLSIVGKMIGKTKRISESDIYDAMLYIHDLNQKITINKLADHFGCTTRTIHRNMSNELKKEKELLNQSI